MIEEFDYNNSFYSIKECKNFLNNEASNINNAKNEGMLTACFHYIEEYEKKLKEEYLDKLEPLFSVKCIDDSFLGDAMIFKPVAEGSVYNVYKKDDEKNSYVIKDDNNNLTSVPKHFFKMEEGSPKKICAENDRLLALLNYSFEAIDYWFDSCDVEENLRKENDYYKSECSYFINKLKK